MIRFILRRDYAYHSDGIRTTDYFTIDGDTDAVECALKRGGFGESGFDQTTFVGIEVIEPTATKEPCRG